MDGLHRIFSYFPDLTERQKEQFAIAAAVYREWNLKINVISRKDMENLEEHHFLHSLAIGRFTRFSPGTQILDAGTGGGFPGIPLAILFPEVHFILADSIGKKLKVADAVAEACGLSNVTTLHERTEKIRKKVDFVTGRAVTAIPAFVSLVRHLVGKEQKNELANGILYLKGGDFAGELEGLPYSVNEMPLTRYYTEPFFETKKLLYIPIP